MCIKFGDPGGVFDWRGAKVATVLSADATACTVMPLTCHEEVIMTVKSNDCFRIIMPKLFL